MKLQRNMDMGIEDTITDACVPIKLFHGHVRNIMNRVDYVLARLVSVNREATFCPKFLGLPDMLSCSIPNLKNMLEVRIDLKESRVSVVSDLYVGGTKTRKGIITTYNAFLKACQL